MKPIFHPEYNVKEKKLTSSVIKKKKKRLKIKMQRNCRDYLADE